MSIPHILLYKCNFTNNECDYFSLCLKISWSYLISLQWKFSNVILHKVHYVYSTQFGRMYTFRIVKMWVYFCHMSDLTYVSDIQLTAQSGCLSEEGYIGVETLGVHSSHGVHSWLDYMAHSKVTYTVQMSWNFLYCLVISLQHNPISSNQL